MALQNKRISLEENISFCRLEKKISAKFIELNCSKLWKREAIQNFWYNEHKAFIII
jgi:hypothetical protein